MTVNSRARNRALLGVTVVGIAVAGWYALPGQPSPTAPVPTAPASQGNIPAVAGNTVTPEAPSRSANTAATPTPQAIRPSGKESAAAAASPAPGAAGPAAQAPATPPARTSPAPASPAVTQAAPALQPGAAQATAPTPPRFDVVRVGQRGMVVTAGRAAPRADVTLFSAQKELGRARSDSRGEWTILPEAPLAPGVHELVLRARSAGGEDIQGPDTVVVVVPEPPVVTAGEQPRQAPGAQATPPVAVLLQDNAAPRVLQAARGNGGGFGLDIIDYDDKGMMRFLGTAPKGSTVRAYVDESHAGDVAANAEGRWTMVPSPLPAPGRHVLRLDQLDARGQVVARVEMPFQRDDIAQQAGRSDRIVVQPGNNLWRIARSAYGKGMQYTLIFAANREQIRDPALIFPGQIFAMPEPR